MTLFSPQAVLNARTASKAAKAILLSKMNLVSQKLILTKVNVLFVISALRYANSPYSQENSPRITTKKPGLFPWLLAINV